MLFETVVAPLRIPGGAFLGYHHADAEAPESFRSLPETDHPCLVGKSDRGIGCLVGKGCPGILLGEDRQTEKVGNDDKERTEEAGEAGGAGWPVFSD